MSACIYACTVVVAKRNNENPVTLTCDTETDGAVTWKFHGEVMEDVVLQANVQQDGRTLTVSDVDTPMLGQYSCWRGGEMLSSTYLLLEAEEEDELGEILVFYFSIISLFIYYKEQESLKNIKTLSLHYQHKCLTFSDISFFICWCRNNFHSACIHPHCGSL